MKCHKSIAARWRDRQDQGMALILVTLVGSVLMSVVAISASNATKDLDRATSEERRSAAFQAAEAGVDDYISKLTEDHSYHLRFVHPAESTRVSGATTTVGGQSWNGSLTWTYPSHNLTWRVLPNGYSYNIEVTPPTAGSPNITLVVVGKAPTTAELRKLEVVVRTGSIADFQMIANADISYGSTATTNGKIYAGIDSSNVAHSIAHAGNAYAGLYAEGSVTGMVASRLHSPAQTYGATTNPSIRTAVQSPIVFNNFTDSVIQLKAAAGTGGVLLDLSTVNAWRLQFTAAGTIVIAKCTKSGGSAVESVLPACVTFQTVNVPTNGAVYVEQTAIVEGVIDGQVTVVSNGNVVIGNDITYETSGNDVLGLMARTDVVMAGWSQNSLSIRAAVIAQAGQYRSDSSAQTKSGTFTHNGATATNLGGYMSQFATRIYDYDATLLYLQPPFFPVLEESYTVLAFRELTQ